MFEKADLVVVARRVATEDTNERSTLPNITPPVSVIGVVTEFQSLLILKGEQGLTRLRLHHYRFASEAEKSIENNAGLVEFSWQRPACLLFLIKERDGRYTPVTGQTDPALYSVLELRSDAH